jgi:sulfonate transport system permease protein
MFVVAAELMGASKGIGFLMNDGQMTGRPGIVIVCILLFAICGKLTDMVIERTGGYFLRWKKAGEQA